ncbi:MAG: serine hydrolase domain-containing protein [Thermodesulfovibrionales bacterium]
MKKYFLVIIALTFLISGCASLSSHRAKQFDNETILKLDKVVSDSLSRYKSPGMVLGVWSNDREYLNASGMADIGTGRRMNHSDFFKIGSLTKTYVGTVILQMIDEGLLSLDDTVDKYINNVPNGKNITIRMLLNMTSGLYNYSESKTWGKIAEENLLYKWDPYELLTYAFKEEPYFPPGQNHHYSNTNTIMLGIIIEKLSRDKLENQIKIRILDRLNLKNTSFPNIPTYTGQYIHGYMYKGDMLEDWSEKMDPSWAWAAGGMISNISDIKTYIKALGDGTFLSKDLQQKRFKDCFKNSLPGYKTLYYCLGAFKVGGFYGHNGGLPGYVNIAMHNPESGTTIVLMLNTQPPGNATVDIFREVFTVLYPDRDI